MAVKWDLENHKPMRGKISRRLLALIENLCREGLL